jgi:hypothetical protein
MSTAEQMEFISQCMQDHAFCTFTLRRNMQARQIYAAKFQAPGVLSFPAVGHGHSPAAAIQNLIEIIKLTKDLR